MLNVFPPAAKSNTSERMTYVYYLTLPEVRGSQFKVLDNYVSDEGSLCDLHTMNFSLRPHLCAQVEREAKHPNFPSSKYTNLITSTSFS